MRQKLTERQQQVLRIITERAERGDRPPSIPELMEKLRVSSPNGIAKHLRALEAKGYIVREKGARGIRLAGAGHEHTGLAYVPLVGEIAAGVPILAQESIEEMVPVPDSMAESGSETFFLRVKGESMIGEGIMPGDLVMIAKTDTVSDGELAAVMVDGEATVKRFRRRGGLIVLEPANPDYEPIAVDPTAQCAVVGRVIGLLRSYRRKL